ncbi:MAG: hypothetical protein EBY28_26540, partial [Betaproteobacteria bacterium]|nr:hypothetical protein [Betaproteobacteria bacterium]
MGPIGQVVEPFQINGLQNGTTYSFQVKASYDNRDTNYSNVITVIPDLKPNQPSITECTPGYKSITVIFTKSTDNDGSSINYYYVYYSTSTVTISSTKIQVPSTGVASYSIPITADLITTDGTNYNIVVAAFNTLLSDLSTPIFTVKPYTDPSAPGRPSLTPGNQQITVNFTASTFSGYGTISYYRIYYSTTTVTTSTSTYVDVSTNNNALIPSPKLTNGLKYNVAIAAFNGSYSTLSDPSSVYPFTTPTNTVITDVVPGDGIITVYLTPPTNNGGFPIIGYGYHLSLTGDNNEKPTDTNPDPNIDTISYGFFANTSTTATSVIFSSFNGSSTLTNGTRYYMLLISQATNLNNGDTVWGNENILSSTVPYTTPSVPFVTLSDASGTIIVTNTVPVGNNSTSTPNNGGSILTSYTLTRNPPSGTIQDVNLLTTYSAASPGTTT